MGARVELFTPRPEGVRPRGLEFLPIHPLPTVRGGRAERERALLAANVDLRRALEQRGPFDLVYERYSLWSYAGAEYAAATGTPCVLEVNAPLIEEQAEHRGLVHRREAERVAEQVFRSATVLIAVSDEVARYLRSYPASKSRVHVVPNGVDPHRFCLRNGQQEARSDKGPFTIGFVGTLKRWHGLPVLVEAFALLHKSDPRSRLLIVGDGPEREPLEAQLSSWNLRSAAQLTGSVEAHAVPDLLAEMDAAVAPYPMLPDFYFSPLKVLEYMAAGLPVVASRIGQIEQLIRHEECGLLCPPGDAVALAQQLARLQQDPELCGLLGRNARSQVLREHTWDMAVRRILALVEQETSGFFSPSAPSRQANQLTTVADSFPRRVGVS
jgi:glycosyltransferase involved in cell wall biosynthesis